MTLSINELTAIISTVVSIPTSITIFFLSQNYLIERNRRRLITNLVGIIELKDYKNENKKNRTFYWYLSHIHAYRMGLYSLLLFILFIIGKIMSGNQFYALWLIASLLYVPVFIIALPLIGNMIKSIEKKPYKFVFERYPMDHSLAFSLYLLAFLSSYLTTNIDRLRLYLFLIPIIILVIFLFVWVFPNLIMLVSSRDEAYLPIDIMGDLYAFFLKEDIIRKLPYLRISLNGGQLTYGRVSGIRKDVLVLLTYIGKEYVNWESIVSLTVIGSVESD